MTDTELRQLIEAAAELLRPHLKRSEPLRRAVSLLGKWLCEEVDGISIGAPGVEPVRADDRPMAEVGPALDQAETRAPAAEAVARHAPAPPASARSRPPASAVVPLRLGGESVQLAVPGTSEEAERARRAAEPPPSSNGWATTLAQRLSLDLALVERRCRLKADSCRLYVERLAAPPGSETEHELRRRMDAMIAQAKALPACFLWVFWRERPQPDPQSVPTIAQAYEVHADAAAAMRKVDEELTPAAEDVSEALRLLAEANSALRVALEKTWLGNDRDQEGVHYWLRHETSRRHMFIQRHMTLDDRADPQNARDLQERIGRLVTRVEQRAQRDKAIKTAISQVRYHSGLVSRHRAESATTHWTRTAQAIETLRELGIPASDRRIIDALDRDAVRAWSAELANSIDLTTAIEARRALDERPADDELDEPDGSPARWSPAVEEVRDLLRGRHLVLIGGQRNDQAVARMVGAFELGDVEWVELVEHGSGEPMRAPIWRAETAVVVVIVKLTGHQHADEARAAAEAAGKPCVYLSGGYNPERVARAILDQASQRLAVVEGH
ncbi:MAG: hypothetical protein CHACPFDD_01575 [Phycisphaerae bacterium]|nr:hypothetical protein [Phycisphaerae bacterium]